MKSFIISVTHLLKDVISESKEGCNSTDNVLLIPQDRNLSVHDIENMQCLKTNISIEQAKFRQNMDNLVPDC